MPPTTPPATDTTTPPPRAGLDPRVLGNPTLARNARIDGVEVCAVGSYAPPTRRSNEELQASLGVDADWVIRRTGIRERRHTAPGLATSDLAHEAANRCLSAAGVRAEEIDLLIVATMTPDLATPSTACLLQNRLGLSCGAFDVSAACAGFVYALVTGAQFVRSGAAKRCLVVGADAGSRIIDPTDRETYPLFGDAAGAVLLGPCEKGRGLLACQLGADGSGAGLLHRGAGGSRHPLTGTPADVGLQYLRMDGRAVFRWAVEAVSESTARFLRDAAVSPADVDLFVPHQANLRLVRALAERLTLPEERVYTNLDRYGNTLAASIPLALDEAANEGRVRRGDLLLLTGFGAGLAWGSVLLRW